MSDIHLQTEIRMDQGKGASRRLRRNEDKVPAILYGGGETPQSLMIEHRFIIKALENEAFYSSILKLHIDGKEQLAVLKALQRHPFKPRIIHLDFQRITGKEKITMHIPLHFDGEDVAPGVKAGGIIQHILTDIEVRCLPKDLPEFIRIDLSQLGLDQTIHLNELNLPKGVEVIAHDPQGVVVSIHLPRVAAIEEETASTAESAETDTSSDSTTTDDQNQSEDKI